MVKKILLGVGLLALVILIAKPALAADTAGVSATVTPKLISVSVSPGSVAYGTVDLDTEVAPTGDPTINATNDGNVTENFNIRGTDATFGANTWTLSGSSNGPDQYMHKRGLLEFAPFTTSYSTLALLVQAGGGTEFKLRLLTPTTTSAYGEYATTITIQATE